MVNYETLQEEKRKQATKRLLKQNQLIEFKESSRWGLRILVYSVNDPDYHQKAAHLYAIIEIDKNHDYILLSPIESSDTVNVQIPMYYIDEVQFKEELDDKRN